MSQIHAGEYTAFMLLGRVVVFLSPRHQETADYIEARYG